MGAIQVVGPARGQKLARAAVRSRSPQSSAGASGLERRSDLLARTQRGRAAGLGVSVEVSRDGNPDEHGGVADRESRRRTRRAVIGDECDAEREDERDSRPQTPSSGRGRPIAARYCERTLATASENTEGSMIWSTRVEGPKLSPYRSRIAGPAKTAVRTQATIMIAATHSAARSVRSHRALASRTRCGKSMSPTACGRIVRTSPIWAAIE